MRSKKDLAIYLSKLKVFNKPKVRLEQYPTNTDIAADVIWNAFFQKDLKVVADLGAGTGILGLGCLVMGAEKVYFVEKDLDAIAILKENLIKVEEEYDIGEYEIINSDIAEFNTKVDTTIMNSPFGVQNVHADKQFLQIAFLISKVVYSLHKLESGKFISKFSTNNKFEITHLWKYDYLIRNTMKYHTKDKHRFMIGCWRMSKI